MGVGFLGSGLLYMSSSKSESLESNPRFRLEKGEINLKSM